MARKPTTEELIVHQTNVNRAVADIQELLSPFAETDLPVGDVLREIAVFLKWWPEERQQTAPLLHLSAAKKLLKGMDDAKAFNIYNPNTPVRYQAAVIHARGRVRDTLWLLPKELDDWAFVAIASQVSDTITAGRAVGVIAEYRPTTSPADSPSSTMGEEQSSDAPRIWHQFRCWPSMPFVEPERSSSVEYYPDDPYTEAMGYVVAAPQDIESFYGRGWKRPGPLAARDLVRVVSFGDDVSDLYHSHDVRVLFTPEQAVCLEVAFGPAAMAEKVEVP